MTDTPEIKVSGHFNHGITITVGPVILTLNPMQARNLRLQVSHLYKQMEDELNQVHTRYQHAYQDAQDAILKGFQNY